MFFINKNHDLSHLIYLMRIKITINTIFFIVWYLYNYKSPIFKGIINLLLKALIYIYNRLKSKLYLKIYIKKKDK